MKKSICTLLISLIIWNLNSQISNNDSHFGTWKYDSQELPYFMLNFHKEQNPWYPFSHFQGTGSNIILTNQWGDVNVYSTEYGVTNISPAKFFTRGGFYPMIQVDGELISLIISELDAEKSVKYGVGYTEFSGELHRENIKLKITYRICTPFDYSKGFLARVRLENMMDKPLKAEFSVNSDIWIKPTYNNVKEWREIIKNSSKKLDKGRAEINHIDNNFKSIALVGNQSYIGDFSSSSIRLKKNIYLTSNQKEVADFKFGINEDYEAYQKALIAFEKDSSNTSWVDVLKPLKTIAQGNWMDRENIWTYSQLLSMCFYDTSLQEHFIHLGGYGLGRDPANPDNGFSMREVAETGIVMSYFTPELTKSSLKWMAKTQLVSGDLKRSHDFYPLALEPESQRLDKKFPDESDTEIWFLITCGEYFSATKDLDYFDEKVPYRTQGKTGSMWEHMVNAYKFIKNDIGTGKNGLIKMLHGDWNDYLSRTGSAGNGQSLMNTGMMCRALIKMHQLAEARQDPIATELKNYLKTLQKAVAASFDREWFVRAYDDEGNPIGTSNDRLFLNAQSWAVLGQCGTEEQRKKSLMNAVKLCSTPIGMTLMSKPYSSPSPENISWSPIPAGEGENAGIWPQTGAWLIWALAEEGLTKVALQEWEKSTLSNHTKLYPQVPFGIFNGPDCYSSHFANEREGWTQIEMFDRMIPVPMNPIIAWQAFGMRQIEINKKK
ncbi:glycosyl hydrolase family 36 [Jejuia pallidilutea]|uniref:Glycosyl hydrolase family 36 n=1 Tax=Jejuia pallidilutea TaxID=504487 RepID=A0A362XGR7_9FLAO|nr:hypothetical protein [Jejuia pallidilutea]PQV51502.1 glycosyl hydrolase family 36 [Jejuia pallidilutea]